MCSGEYVYAGYMNEITAPRFKFGQAAYGAGITPKTLRNWLQRGQIELFNERGEDDPHFAFSLGDLAVLSLVAQLVRYGMPVSTAFEGIVKIRREIALLASYQNTPLKALEVALNGKQIWAMNHGEEWALEVVYGIKHLSFDAIEEAIPSLLIIDVAVCFGEVLRRVADFEVTASAFKSMGEKDSEEFERLMEEGRDETLDRATFAATFSTPKEKPE